MTEFVSTNIDMIVLILVSACAFAAVLGVTWPMLAPDPLASRLKQVTKQREELSKLQIDRLKLTRRRRTIAQMGQLGPIKAVIGKLNRQTTKAIRLRLAKAGWRGQVPMIVYVVVRLLLPIVFGALTAIFLFGAPKLDLEQTKIILICIGATVAGFYFPNVIVANVITKRQQELRKGLPDALDLLVICVEAGLALDASINRIVAELEDSSPILAEEFGLTGVELAFLGDRREALLNLGERTGLVEFKSLVTALIQAERHGVSLATTMRVLAAENRDARLTRAEEKAGRLPATLTVPMMVFFLPVLFIVLLGPAAIQVIDTFGKS